MPATASADDASLFRAYHGHDEEIKRKAKKIKELGHRMEEDGVTKRRLQRAIRLFQGLRRILWDIRSDITAEQPSSEDGSRAKTLALKGIATIQRGLKVMIRGFRAGVRKRWSELRSRVKRGVEIVERGERQTERAERAFRDAGFD